MEIKDWAAAHQSGSRIKAGWFQRLSCVSDTRELTPSVGSLCVCVWLLFVKGGGVGWLVWVESAPALVSQLQLISLVRTKPAQCVSEPLKSRRHSSVLPQYQEEYERRKNKIKTLTLVTVGTSSMRRRLFSEHSELISCWEVQSLLHRHVRNRWTGGGVFVLGIEQPLDVAPLLPRCRLLVIQTPETVVILIRVSLLTATAAADATAAASTSPAPPSSFLLLLLLILVFLVLDLGAVEDVDGVGRQRELQAAQVLVHHLFTVDELCAVDLRERRTRCVGEDGEPIRCQRLQLQGDDGQSQRGAFELPELVAGHTVLHLPGPQRRLEARRRLLRPRPGGKLPGVEAGAEPDGRNEVGVGGDEQGVELRWRRNREKRRGGTRPKR
ncbi:hypothetical protein INR49_022524 [Caranx melampygus]|nr:hypothetical protein INR49_022524 [Caranx melampygus]